MVYPYNSIDTIAAWKKLRFISSVRSDFHTTDSLSIAIHAFVSRVSMSFIIKQVLGATPHKAPTVRPPASHHENYPS